MDKLKDPLSLILERLEAIDKRMEGLEQRLEQIYEDLDRDVVNLHTDLTNFRFEVGAHFEDNRQDIKWLTDKWVQHDKAIHQIKAAK